MWERFAQRGRHTCGGWRRWEIIRVGYVVAVVGRRPVCGSPPGWYGAWKLELAGGAGRSSGTGVVDKHQQRVLFDGNQ